MGRVIASKSKPPTIQILADQVRAEMQRRGWSLRELSRQTLIAPSTLSAWLSGKQDDPQWSTVFSVMRKLDIRELPQ